MKAGNIHELRPSALLMNTVYVPRVQLSGIVNPRRLLILGGVCAAVIIFTGVFLYTTSVGAFTEQRQGISVSETSHPTVYLSGQAAASATAANSAPMREMHIANNGLILLRGAQIVGENGREMKVRLSWGSSDFTWKLETDTNTKFFDTQGQPLTAGDFRVGDFVTVSGALVASGSEPTIQAQFVHE